MRIKANYRASDLGCLYFDQEDLQCIEMKAKALSLEECLLFLCVPKADVPERDMEVAEAIHGRGRLTGVATAVDKLFNAMSMRGGQAASLEYLKQMSGEFEVTATPSASAKSGFSFTVTGVDKD